MKLPNGNLAGNASANRCESADIVLHQPLRVEGREVGVHRRRHVNAAESFNAEGEVLARSRGTFIAIDPEKMFANFVER